MAPDTIVGREPELADAVHLLGEMTPGPRSLLVAGDAGIGKTTIWQEVVRIAGPDSRVLTSRASQIEAKLSFAVLTDLFGSTLHEIGDELPGPQRRALESALLLEAPVEGSRLDARAVSLGTLAALRGLAVRGPVVIAIDDVQWTDGPSARALGFALRRLIDESVTVIAAARVAPGFAEPIGLGSMVGFRRLDLGPLSVDELGRLLRQRGYALPRPVVVRIHEASGGNPFYAQQIGRALALSSTRPRAGEPLPVPDDLQALLHERVVNLSGDAREALLVAAAATTPTAELVDSVCGSDLMLEEAAREGIITLRGSAIGFTHPLLASAVYLNAAPSSRRAVHRQLAGRSADPEQTARHLALSSAGPNEAVAAALDRAAVQARSRGAPQAAAELSELAVATTPAHDLEGRQRRMQLQAGNLFDAGDPQGARELLGALIPSLEPGPVRAEIRYLLSSFTWKDLKQVEDLLRQAFDEAGQGVRLRSLILADLSWVALDRGDLAVAAAHGQAAVDLATSLDDEDALRRALPILGLARCLLGQPSRPSLERAVELQGALTSADLSSPTTCLARVLTWSGELDEARRACASELIRYREQGHETSCYEILAHLAEVEYRAGRFDRAMSHVDEAVDIALEATIDVLGELLPVRAAVACSLGDLEAAARDAEEGLAICERTADRWNEIRCRSVLGSVEISRDDHAAAHAWLAPLPELTDAMGLREPGAFPFVPDAVEALIGLGELGRAEELADRLDRQGQHLDRHLALGTAARCHGLVTAARGDLAEAAALLERSEQILRSVPQPFDLARTLFFGGEIQRRMKKKTSAREWLGGSIALFEEIGASLWARKARRAQARIGGRPPSPSELTPSEEEIALRVADGRTNREIAAALFMSVNTVESNLKRIYRKLGVRSRVELTNWVGERSPSS